MGNSQIYSSEINTNNDNISSQNKNDYNNDNYNDNNSNNNISDQKYYINKNANSPNIILNHNIKFFENISPEVNLSQIISKFINIPIFDIKSYSTKNLQEKNTNNLNDNNINIKSSSTNDLILYEILNPFLKKEEKNNINNNNINNNNNNNDEEEINETPLESTAGSYLKDIREIYKFKDQIGSGHFGHVHTAVRRMEKAPYKLYAIKSISKKNLTENQINGLTKEVEIVSQLDHPNIINFYETYHDEFYFHIVMELCRGKDLLNKLKEFNGKIPEKKVCLIMIKILYAISYCHSRGITHRDLKPENIMFETPDEESDIKILDFGLSRKYLINEKMHTILGTPYYIAPEVLKSEYDEKCDIWSIGAIAYILLCGEPPFYGKSNNEIFKKIIHNEINFNVNGKWKNISNDAKNFVKLCLSKDPKIRPNANEALKHSWFKNIFEKIHSELYIHKNILINLKNFKPCLKFKKLVIKYLISNMGHNEIKIYKMAFFAFDFDNTGTIKGEEILKGFNFGKETIDNEQIKKILSAADDRNRKSLDYSEFLLCCLNLKKILNKEKLEIAFRYFDIDGNGEIDVVDLKNALLRLGKNVNEEKSIKKIILDVTKNKKETIDYQNFLLLFNVV